MAVVKAHLVEKRFHCVDSKSLIETELERMGLSDNNDQSTRLSDTKGIFDRRDRKWPRMKLQLMNHLLPNSPDHYGGTTDLNFVLLRNFAICPNQNNVLCASKRIMSVECIAQAKNVLNLP